MNAPAPEFYETWKAIAQAINRSERWCRYTAMRLHDPLPVFKVGGMVRLNRVDLEAWIERQQLRGGIAMKPLKTRVVACPRCHTEVALRVDGVMKTHQVPGRAQTCAGSCRSPGPLS